MDYEYGVAQRYRATPHRANMTLDEARAWIREWVHMGGREDEYRIVRRPIARWEDVND